MTLLLLILCPCLFALGLFAGALLQMMESRDDRRPRLMHDNLYSRAVLGDHALLFGPDGEIIEARWYSRDRSAVEFGGRPRDYAPGWIDWEGEAVNFKPTGLLAVPEARP